MSTTAVSVTKDLWEQPWKELNLPTTTTGRASRVGLTRDSAGRAVLVALIRLPGGQWTFVGMPLAVVAEIARSLRWSAIAVEELGL